MRVTWASSHASNITLLDCTFFISVKNWTTTPPQYVYRILNKDYVKKLDLDFVTLASYSNLMPIGVATNTPLKIVEEERLKTYNYWILSGQNSIVVATTFSKNKSTKYASRKEFYRYRTIRIVLDAPKEVVVWTSKMESIKT